LQKKADKRPAMMRSRRLSLPMALSAVAVIALAYLLGWSPLFTVDKVTITGSPNSAVQSEIAKISQVEIGQKLARVNPSSVERKVSQIPWIKDVSLSRNWVSGEVDISLTSRKPLAFFNALEVPGQTIDEEGALFTLPGFTSTELALISAKSPESALKANELFIALPTDFRKTITSMSATSTNTFTFNTLYKGREIRIRWGDSQEISLKISVIGKLLELPENKAITLIDVVAPHAPIVK
jgi:cell division protein FtsQ